MSLKERKRLTAQYESDRRGVHDETQEKLERDGQHSCMTDRHIHSRYWVVFIFWTTFTPNGKHFATIGQYQVGSRPVFIRFASDRFSLVPSGNQFPV